MKKQIDLSGLYKPERDIIEREKLEIKASLKRSLAAHLLLNPTGNDYYPVKGISFHAKINSPRGAANLSHPNLQNELHRQCRQIMSNKHA